MIWDFRGRSAERTAEHHRIHLDDFIRMEKLNQCETGLEKVSDSYTMAYMVVPKDMVPALREKLKPHRGQIHRQ
ncbi:hypothetical protein BST85_02755 [Aureitalea marina]|uniref:Uncharacterized protein n=2 Tax=Aureitalea marina TaxID=930804 RepID=A0A2S7KTI4_9FLAO|nr:hypothetical protein BST85_02755 [Aureitalea marina]